MIDCIDMNIGAHIDVVSNGDLSNVKETAIVVDLDMVPEKDVVSVVTAKDRLNNTSTAIRTEQLLGYCVT
ncbi:hypothetical protein BDB01DRAFT_351274 [Pilobolus umbonatus]|nr:hypothetical protein BDB01DRAFT_351274 [Pilobolus umbonatus]